MNPKFILSFALSGVGLVVSNVAVSAQTESVSPIKVESHEVLLPVEVVEQRKDPKGLLTGPDGRQWHVYLVHSSDVAGLTEKSFHIFEDGVEQNIEHFSIERFASWAVNDNLGKHGEYSCTPKGIWRGMDEPNVEPDKPWQIHTYLLTYVPPSSPTGTCHRIQLKVDHKNAMVLSPTQYCSTADPLSDPLNDTDLGNKLLASVDSTAPVALPFSLQTSTFAASIGSSPNSSRIIISAQIPAHLLDRSWDGARLETSIAILGLVYDSNDVLTSRFSDTACFPSELDAGYNGPLSPNEKNIPPLVSDIRRYLEDLTIPTGYRTQIQLQPGNYRLELLLTDGRKFGRASTALNVDDFSSHDLTLSGIALCKRFHRPLPEEQGPTRAPQFVPLMFDGMEFTLTGDTRFKKGEQLMTYVEIYSPQFRGPVVPTVYLEMKVIDEKTHELKIGTGVRAVDSPARPDHSAIPVVWEMEVAKLPAGTYQLEVQASDSVGHKSDWRTTSFTVE